MDVLIFQSENLGHFLQFGSPALGTIYSEKYLDLTTAQFLRNDFFDYCVGAFAQTILLSYAMIFLTLGKGNRAC